MVKNDMIALTLLISRVRARNQLFFSILTKCLKSKMAARGNMLQKMTRLL
jgi:hypothetical protein